MPGLFSVQAEGVEGIQHQPFPDFVPTLPFFPKIWWSAFTLFSTSRFGEQGKSILAKQSASWNVVCWIRVKLRKEAILANVKKQLQSAEEPFRPVSIKPNQLGISPWISCALEKDRTPFVHVIQLSVYIYNIYIYIYTRFSYSGDSLTWRF